MVYAAHQPAICLSAQECAFASVKRWQRWSSFSSSHGFCRGSRLRCPLAIHCPTSRESLGWFFNPRNSRSLLYLERIGKSFHKSAELMYFVSFLLLFLILRHVNILLWSWLLNENKLKENLLNEFLDTKWTLSLKHESNKLVRISNRTNLLTF